MKKYDKLIALFYCIAAISLSGCGTNMLKESEEDGEKVIAIEKDEETNFDEYQEADNDDEGVTYSLNNQFDIDEIVDNGVAIDNGKNYFPTLCFGTYEQDGDSDNGTEPIEWYILKETDEKYLLMSKYSLDSVPYGNPEEEVSISDLDGYSKVKWENSYLRSWLNSYFYDNAFSIDDKTYIEETDVINSTNNYFNDTNAGNDTKDYVFVLSNEEFEDIFGINYGIVYPNAIVYPTKYCVSKGAITVEVVEGNINEYAHRRYNYDDVEGILLGWWWLRSTRTDGGNTISNYGCTLGIDGLFDKDGVRPVIWMTKEAVSDGAAYIN